MRPHILLVEDSPLVVGALRTLLEETGHRVSTATTVHGAIAAARADPPDLILLDLTLEREDGLAVVAELSRDGGPRPTVVALTGHDEPAVRERCLQAGCRDVLVKPISARDLPGKIRAWLEG